MLSLFEEFDDEAYIAAVREDGRNEGRAEGIEEGRAEGIEEGIREGKIAERNNNIRSINQLFLSEGMPAPAAAAKVAQLLGLPVNDVNRVLGQ